jgi:capsule biosynthesis phosphatase
MIIPDNVAGKIFCVDLDETLCFHHSVNDTYERYGLALPNTPVIEKVNFWKSQGARIIIFTARRMLTHKGDLAKIEADVGDITRNWLKEHGVQYDELIFGKPYADFYIDDKAVNVTEL